MEPMVIIGLIPNVKVIGNTEIKNIIFGWRDMRVKLNKKTEKISNITFIYPPLALQAFRILEIQDELMDIEVEANKHIFTHTHSFERSTRCLHGISTPSFKWLRITHPWRGPLNPLSGTMGCTRQATATDRRSTASHILLNSYRLLSIQDI